MSVIDGASNAGEGTPIPVGTGPWQVSVNPTTNRAYVTVWTGHKVSVIDGASNAVDMATVTVGDYPHGITANRLTNRIYVANPPNNTVSVIQDFPMPGVGGIAELAAVEPNAAAGESGSSGPGPVAPAALAAAGALLLATVALYARWRWLR